MKLVNLKHNEDYVRFSKSLTIKMNEFITAEVDIYGGVGSIDSKLFGKVIVLEDPDTCPTYYIGGKKTKHDGFKKLYNELFQDDYNDFVTALEKFVENKVLNTFDNSITNLTKKQQIKLFKEQLYLLPTFESTCGKTIVYRQWAINEVLYMLNIKAPKSKKYERLLGTGTNWGVDLDVYSDILDELLDK